MYARRHPLSVLFQEANRIQDDMNRLFGYTPTTSSATNPGPRFNVWEDETAFYAEADLPGLSPDSIEVTLTEGNQLTISGERRTLEVPASIWHRHERPTGPFTRVLPLPALVDADKVEAVFEAGVLQLTLPKSEAAKPRKITVKSN